MTSNENTQVDPVMHRWFHDQGPLVSAAAEVIGDAILRFCRNRDNPEASPTIDTLTRVTGRSKSTIIRAAAELQKSGHFVVQQFRNSNGLTRNRYIPTGFSSNWGQYAEAEETMTDIALTTQDYSDLPKLPKIIRWGRVTGPRLPSSHRFVLITLCNYANEAGEFYLDTAAVAWDCDMNTATVDRVVHDLARLGLIRFEIVQATHQEQLTHCQLAGARSNWTPQPKDPGQKLSLAEAVFAQLEAASAAGAQI